MNFNIEKKGYSIKEVDDFLISNQIENDRILAEKQSRINELREENYKLSKALDNYKKKEEYISSALTNATQRAAEIEENAKTAYSLEIKNVKGLFDKWDKFLKTLIKRYPKMKDFDPDEVLDNMRTEIDKTLQEDFAIEESSNSGNEDAFKKLLSRIKRHNLEDRKIKTIKRSKEYSDEIIEEENERENLSEINRVNNIKPITNLTLEEDEADEFENLVDKFLNTQNITTPKGYEKSILSSGKKKKSNSKYPEPNESGFDLEQALNPTEDLYSIMKGFNLD